eukprot:GCRY01000750.1.p1 GENE.GCRY01000750.1~~GCRY01000750.1.p1  ORF type:complete len:547 (-),score=79.11 GCRY01000750.1:454-2004(-)
MSCDISQMGCGSSKTMSLVVPPTHNHLESPAKSRPTKEVRPSLWSAEKLLLWLKDNGFSNHVGAFKKMNSSLEKPIDGSVILTFFEHDLLVYGFEEEEERKRFLHIIDQLRMVEAQYDAEEPSLSSRLASTRSFRQTSQFEKHLYTPRIDFNSFQYNVFSHVEEKGRMILKGTLLSLFERLNLFGDKFTPSLLASTISEVELRYHNFVPYHNFLHCIDVTQTLYFCLHNCGAKEHLSKTDIIAVMLAGLCHDLNHQGLNNVFQKKTNSDLFREFGEPTLEKMHYSVALEVLAGANDDGLLSVFDEKTRTRIQDVMRNSILATDMARHQEYCETFRQLIVETPPTKRDPTVISDLVPVMLVKFADISNLCKPFPISRLWSARLLKEMFRQGDRERALSFGENISPLCDRAKVNYAMSQIGFGRLIVQPLVELLVTFLPRMDIFQNQLLSNIVSWEAVSDYETHKFELLIDSRLDGQGHGGAEGPAPPPTRPPTTVYMLSQQACVSQESLTESAPELA